MLELFLLRHGQTDFSRRGRYCGRIDPPLNEVGLRMAEAFAKAHETTTWDAIYSSPRLRTQQTGEKLWRHLSLSPAFEEGLAEIGYGEFEGLSPDEARTRSPNEFTFWMEDSTGRAPPGGETAFDVAARALPVIDRIRATHEHGRVLVVSHKATLRVVTCALLGMDVRSFRNRIGYPVAGLSRFAFTDNGPMLVSLGDVSHLPAELRTEEGS